MNANILVIDDIPENLKLLTAILREQGYKVRAFSEGAFAMESAKATPPDVILLDIKMPGINGFEVCERLKRDPRTRNVPVIFISALQDIDNKVKGLTLGAADYVTKPFQAEEVLARVQTQLTIQQLHRELEQKNRQLERSLSELRETNAAREVFLSILAHDLRSPFNTLLLMTEVLAEDFDRYPPAEVKKKIHDVHEASKSLHALVENLLEWSRLERGMLAYTPEDTPLFALIAQNIQLVLPQAAQKQIQLDNTVPESVIVYADRKMLNTILRNLLSNALKFTDSGGSVCISAQDADNEHVDITVTDTGIGMTPESIEEVFRIDRKQNTRGTAGEEGSGLGLTLCKGLVEKHGGTIHLESEIGKGTRCRVLLPCKMR